MKTYAPVSLVLAIAAVTACDSGEPGELEAGSESVRVTVSAPAVVGSRTQIPARVVSRKTANLATRMSGSVQAVTVDVGQPVRAGQILVRLDDAGAVSNIARAEAQATIAERTYARISSLERDGAATRQELDQAEAGLRGAQAALNEARAALEYVTMRAPFDGTVTARYADPGDLAVPGRPVLTVSGAQGVKIEADVPSSLAPAISTGDRVQVVLAESGDRRSATVTRVVPVIELASQRFRVEAAFDAGEETPPAGSFARLEIAGDGEASTWVPADAVVRRGQLTGLYLVDDGALRLRWIRIGQSTSEAVEVLAGLPIGAPVVRHPQPSFLDGGAVAGVDEEEWAYSPDGGR